MEGGMKMRKEGREGRVGQSEGWRRSGRETDGGQDGERMKRGSMEQDRKMNGIEGKDGRKSVRAKMKGKRGGWKTE